MSAANQGKFEEFCGGHYQDITIMVDKLAVTGGQEVRANMWVYIRDVIDEKCSRN